MTVTSKHTALSGQEKLRLSINKAYKKAVLLVAQLRMAIAKRPVK